MSNTQRMMIVHLRMGSISVTGEAPASYAGLDHGVGAACTQALTAFRKKLTPQVRMKAHVREHQLNAQAHITGGTLPGKHQLVDFSLNPLSRRITGHVDSNASQLMADTVADTLFKAAKLL